MSSSNMQKGVQVNMQQGVSMDIVKATKPVQFKGLPHILVFNVVMCGMMEYVAHKYFHVGVFIPLLKVVWEWLLGILLVQL